MPLLADRSKQEGVLAVTGAWLAFTVALTLSLPQPPSLLQIAVGSVAGALVIVVGFAAVTRCRMLPSHALRERARLASLAAVAGGVMGFVLLGALVFLARHEPALRARFAGRLSEPAWRPWALAFESSILEEVVFRLFVMGVVAWIAARWLKGPHASWLTALVVSTLLFGAAHLPAWLSATHGTPGLVAGVMVLNGAGGLLLGWVFWRWGLPYAIVCHFFGDVVVQGLGPRLLT